MGSQMLLRNDAGTISAIPYAVLTLVVFGLFLVGMGVVVDALVEVDNDMMGERPSQRRGRPRPRCRRPSRDGLLAGNGTRSPSGATVPWSRGATARERGCWPFPRACRLRPSPPGRSFARPQSQW